MNDFTIKSPYGTGKTVQLDLLGNFLQAHTETYVNVNIDDSEKQELYDGDETKEEFDAAKKKAEFSLIDRNLGKHRDVKDGVEIVTVDPMIYI